MKSSTEKPYDVLLSNGFGGKKENEKFQARSRDAARTTLCQLENVVVISHILERQGVNIHIKL